MSCDLDLRLSVNQSIQQPEVLLLFLFCFGGRVYSDRQQTGTRHAMLVWRVTGIAASRVAQLLYDIDGLGKAAQLMNAVQALEARSSDERRDAFAQLQQLKTEDLPQMSISSWYAFSGFFDAEGSVTLSWRGDCYI